MTQPIDIKTFINMLDDESLQKRHMAIEALQHQQTPEITRKIIALLDDPHEFVVNQAVLALRYTQDDRTGQSLLRLFLKTDWNITESLAGSTLKYHINEVLLQEMLSLYHDERIPQRKRARLIEAISTSDDPAARTLIRDLVANSEGLVFNHVIKALIKDGTDVSLDVVLEQLQSPVAKRRQTVALYLGDSDSERVIEPLINALNDPVYEVRENAVLSLIREETILSEYALPRLRAMLYDDDTPSRALSATIFALCDDNNTHHKRFEALLMHSAWEVRHEAARAFSEVVYPLAVPALLQLLNDENRSVAIQAAYALKNQSDNRAIVPGQKALNRAALQIIEEADDAQGQHWLDLNEQTAEFIRASAGMLAACGATTLSPLAFQMLTYIDDTYGIIAGDIIEAVGDMRDVARLPDILDDIEGRCWHKNAYYPVEKAATALGNISDESTIPVLIRLLDYPSQSVQVSAAISLLKMNNSNGMTTLYTILTDNTGAGINREKIAHALGEYGTKEAIPHLLEALYDITTGTQLAAIESLVKLQAVAAIETLQKHLTLTHNNAVKKAIEQAIVALEALKPE